MLSLNKNKKVIIYLAASLVVLAICIAIYFIFIKPKNTIDNKNTLAQPNAEQVILNTNVPNIPNNTLVQPVQNISVPSSKTMNDIITLGTFGDGAEGTPQTLDYLCNSRGDDYLDKININSDKFVRSMELICKYPLDNPAKSIRIGGTSGMAQPTLNGPFNKFTAKSGKYVDSFEGYGGPGGTLEELSCPSGKKIIGMNIGATSRLVNKITPYCG